MVRCEKRILQQIAACIAVAVCCPAFAVPLTKADAEALAGARLNGQKVVAIAVVAKAGRHAQAAAGAEAHGGIVRFRFDEVDYLSVHLPINEVAEFTAEPFVEAVTLDRLSLSARRQATRRNKGRTGAKENRVGDPLRDPEIASRPEWPPQPARYPLDKPYPFLRDLDAQSLRAKNPTYDGRGVVIAHVERLGDVLLPELQMAVDSAGVPLPKFADVINVAELEPNLDPDPRPTGREAWMWTRLSDPQSSRDGYIRQDGIRYRMPHRIGEVRIGAIEIDPGLLARINLVGPPEEEFTAFAVLWSQARHTAWLDSDRDQDFTDEMPVKEFKHSGQFGVLGSDDPGTALRESVGYAIQKERDYLSLNLGWGSHATVVAGAVAANRGKDGHIDGIVPGAQLFTVYHGGTASTWSRALITAFADPRTDVVLIEAEWPLWGYYDRKDGHWTLAILLSRLIEHYGKHAVLTAGNDTGLMSGVGLIRDGDHPFVSDALIISGYQSRGATFVHSGWIMEAPEGLHSVGAEGPSGNGDLVPDLLAPANPVTLSPGFSKGQSLDGLFQLPPGYSIGGGSSTATPVAAGAIAMLISAAKQEGLPHDVKTVQRALRSSARFLEGIEAYKQGNGLIQVDAALRQLRAYAREDERIVIEARAPVRTATSALLDEPHVGAGLFEREGWGVGDEGVRTIRLTRRTGPKQPLMFDLTWLGNEDGIFAAPARVSLPLGKQVDVPVSITARTPGAHSSILEVRHQRFAGPINRVLATVVVPYAFTAENSYRLEEKLAVRRPVRRNVFFRVPPGADAFTVEIEHGSESLIGTVISPENQRFNTYLIPDPINGRRAVSFSNPIAGVWQVTFAESIGAAAFVWGSARNVSPPISVQLRASVSGVNIGTESLTSSDDDAASFTVANRFTAIEGGVVSSALGGIRRVDGNLTQGEQRIFEVEIKEGTELLIAGVQPSDDNSADLDLYLFDCVDKTCRLAQEARSLKGRARLLIERPRPGRWTVILNAASSHPSGTKFSYYDIVTHPRFGQLVSSDAGIARSTGQQWIVQSHIECNAVLEKDRTLVAVVYARDDKMHALRRPIPMTGSPFMPFGITNYASDVVPLGLRIIDLD